MDSFYAFAELLIYLSILAITGYAIALGHHWFTYGASYKTSMTAMIIFLSGSAVLIVSLIGAYNFL